MLANTDGDDIHALGQQYKELVAELLDTVGMTPVPLDVDITPGVNFRGFDGSELYVVQRGTLSVIYQDRIIYTLEQGDILLPDIAGAFNEGVAVCYGSETGALVHVYPAVEFLQRVFDMSVAIRLWTRLLIAYAGLMLRITAANSQQDEPGMSGFETYEPGEVIIQQGDKADAVFNMTAGVAEVLVDDVPVGRIGDGEIFGAMAALTEAQRSATVRAKTACSVVRVPKERFTELIRSNPVTIHGLLIDMANSIVNLNEQLVGIINERKVG